MQKFKTPKIPKRIRELKHKGYRNIYSYELGNRHLWGTETFLGDWDGQFLLLAKDFYPTAYIADGKRERKKNPYQHKPTIPTNRNLLKTLKHFGKVDNETSNTDCGFLFASVCFLLRDDDRVRGPLPDAKKVFAISAPVIQFTIKKMPTLRHVVLMGKDAQKAFKNGDFGKELSRRRIKIWNVAHPSATLSDAKRYAEWRGIFK